MKAEERAAVCIHGANTARVCLAPSTERRWDGICLPCAEVADQILAAQAEARAERDREWRAAVNTAKACNGIDPSVTCPRCSVLRALLEGK